MPPAVQRTNTEWLADLKAAGPRQEGALADLREVVMQGLPYALSGWLAPDHPEFDALAGEIAQETLLRVLDRLEAFEGRSQFTTWVNKIAVRLALTELRHRRWRDVSLEAMVGEDSEMGEKAAPAVLKDTAVGPERLVEQSDMLAQLNRLIMEELTERQRQAMMAVALRGMPLEEVARRMGMQRNALYKLMHDARLRLKRRMEAEGMTLPDMLAVFEQG